MNTAINQYLGLKSASRYCYTTLPPAQLKKTLEGMRLEILGTPVSVLLDLLEGRACPPVKWAIMTREYMDLVFHRYLEATAPVLVQGRDVETHDPMPPLFLYSSTSSSEHLNLVLLLSTGAVVPWFGPACMLPYSYCVERFTVWSSCEQSFHAFRRIFPGESIGWCVRLDAGSQYYEAFRIEREWVISFYATKEFKSTPMFSFDDPVIGSCPEVMLARSMGHRVSCSFSSGQFVALMRSQLIRNYMISYLFTDSSGIVHSYSLGDDCYQSCSPDQLYDFVFVQTASDHVEGEFFMEGHKVIGRFFGNIGVEHGMYVGTFICPILRLPGDPSGNVPCFSDLEFCFRTRDIVLHGLPVVVKPFFQEKCSYIHTPSLTPYKVYRFLETLPVDDFACITSIIPYMRAMITLDDYSLARQFHRLFSRFPCLFPFNDYIRQLYFPVKQVEDNRILLLSLGGSPVFFPKDLFEELYSVTGGIVPLSYLRLYANDRDFLLFPNTFNESLDYKWFVERFRSEQEESSFRDRSLLSYSYDTFKLWVTGFSCIVLECDTYYDWSDESESRSYLMRWFDVPLDNEWRDFADASRGHVLEDETSYGDSNEMLCDEEYDEDEDPRGMDRGQSDYEPPESVYWQDFYAALEDEHQARVIHNRNEEIGPFLSFLGHRWDLQAVASNDNDNEMPARFDGVDDLD
jgi:hypothetical protein